MKYVVPPGGSLSAPGPYERHVWVYIPRQLAAGKPAPFMVVQDGHSYVKRMANILDNMIAAKRLPPLVVVLIPGLRSIPAIYKWRIRLGIYRWYRALLALERWMLPRRSTKCLPWHSPRR